MATQTLYGGINSEGNIGFGNGELSVNNSKQSQGIYTLTFGTPFKRQPAVVATQNYPAWGGPAAPGGDTRDNVVITEVTPESVTLKTGDSAGKGVPRNFCYIIMGEVD